MENKQFFTLPTKMTEKSELRPEDLIIYFYLKCYDDNNHEYYPLFSHFL